MSSFITGFEVAASGMSAQRTRLSVISSNVANAQTTRGVDGLPYRRLAVSLEEAPIDSGFDRALEGAARGVNVSDVALENTTPMRRVYEPAHPDADPDGFVDYPNVRLLEEMVDMMMASRSYEANAASFETLKGMAMRALQIGQ